MRRTQMPSGARITSQEERCLSRELCPPRCGSHCAVANVPDKSDLGVGSRHAGWLILACAAGTLAYDGRRERVIAISMRKG